ncbi:hypothetical protein BH18THE2_BH18THE2_22560 [soil metagenome]
MGARIFRPSIGLTIIVSVGNILSTHQECFIDSKDGDVTGIIT